MEEPRIELNLPEEPTELRTDTRSFLEDSPEEGIRLVNAGYPLAGFLWEEWGVELEEAGVDQERFSEITRGYASEIRLWTMGERPWNHCVAGLAGRVLRRLPRQRERQEIASLEMCR
ncbi:MAG TPA: hypothetical protein VJ086_01320 [Rubrobacteraceae bacterium]|nr:hypothetical protein [Rubrobacteraceae bacterium]